MKPEVVLKIEALDNTKQAFASVRKALDNVKEFAGQAFENVKKGFDNVKQFTQDFSKRIEALQPTFQNMAVKGGAAFTAIAAGIGLTVREAQEAEAAQFRLSHILRTATGASDAQVRALNEQAAALEKVGVISAGSITQAQAQLATFDLQAETIERLTPAILDYVVAEKGAAATTEDLKQLTNGLAQALNGNFGSLTRVGFVLDDVTKEMISNGTEAERAAALVSVLNSTYEGMNVAARDTAQGGIIALRNELNGLSETIGQTFMGSLANVTNALIPVISRVTEWVKAHPELTRNLIIAAGAIAGVVAVLGTLGLVILPVITAIKALAAVMMIVISPVGLVVAAITAIGATIYLLRNQIAAFFGFWANLWNSIPGPVQTAVQVIMGPLTLLVGAIKVVVGALSSLRGSMGDTAARTFDLKAIVSQFADPLAGQSKEVVNFGDAIKQVSGEAKEATDKIKKLKTEAQNIFNTVEEDEIEANRRMAEAIVEQEESIKDKKQELRKLERAESSDANEDRVEELRYTIERETEALRGLKDLRASLSTEIEEAERRASLTAFERKMEDMLRERAARLQAQVDRLLEIQAEVDAEKQKSNAIANVFQAGQARMQEAIKVTSSVAVQEADRMSRAFARVFDNVPSFGSTAIRNLSTPTVRRVNDAVISPKGDIISTHPDDWLIATKTPGSLAGGGGPNITINISGTFLDDRTAAQRLSTEIMGVLKHQMRL